MSKTRTAPSPEDLLAEALAENEFSLTAGELRLLTSGFMALRDAQRKPLNEVERRAIAGMIAYVAYTQSVKEETVESIVTATFGVNSLKALPSCRYHEVVEYLVDLQMNNIVN